MSAFVGGRIPDHMLEPLNAVATYFKRSKSFLIGEAIAQYLAEKIEEMEDEKGAKIALARMNNPDRTFCSSEEMTKFIDENCHD